MKKILFLAMIFCFGLSLHAQKSSKKASDYDSYVKMYQDERYNMVRSHMDFVAYINSHPDLKKYFTKPSLLAFLKKMRFCTNGLITFSTRDIKFSSEKDKDRFFEMTSIALGWEPPVLGTRYKGYYCNPPATCDPFDGDVCVSRNCGSSSNVGKDFNAQLAVQTARL